MHRLQMRAKVESLLISTVYMVPQVIIKVLFLKQNEKNRIPFLNAKVQNELKCLSYLPKTSNHLCRLILLILGENPLKS